MKGERSYHSKVMYVILIIVCMCNVVEGRGRIPISVTSGVYWEELEGIVMYEASVPLMYKIKLPGVEMAYLSLPSVNGFCEGMLNDPKCILYSWILQVDKHIGRRVRWLNASMGLESPGPEYEVKNHRLVRSLNFIGDFAHWCCGVAANRQLKPLIANQKLMSQVENGLGQQMGEAFKELDNIDLNMKNYSEQVERTFIRIVDVGVNISKVIDNFQKRVFTMDQQYNNKSFSLLQLGAHHVIRQLQILQLVSRLEILSQCRERKLPTFVVTVDKLKSDLVVLSEAVTEDGYELAVPPEEISKYLNLEIVECIVSDEHILVNLRIPIRRRGSQWKLYELLTVPFAWTDRVCELQIDAAFIAVNGDQLMTLQGRAERDCKPYDNPLCYVPRFTGGVSSSSICVEKIFQGATIQELSSFCVFKCVTGNQPIVSKINNFKYVLTHVTGIINLICRYSHNKTIDLTSQRTLGALEVDVPCDCRLVSSSRVLISDSYPCDMLPRISSVVQTIPASWSKIKSLKLSSLQVPAPNTFDAFSECLDDNWPIQVPHWNLSIADRKVYRVHSPSTSTEGRDIYDMFLVGLHGLFMVLLSIIVVRNPHLIGFCVGNLVVAEDGLMTRQSNQSFTLELLCCITLILCAMFTGKLLVKVYKRCRARNVTPDVQMVARRCDVEDGLPKSVPVAEVDGRELRITLEWWDPARTGEGTTKQHPESMSK